MSDRGGAEPDCARGSKNAVSAAPDRSSASRPAALAAFLGSCGWGGHPPVPLAADASFRSYYRVRRGRRRAVVMDAPPPQEDVAAFAAISRVLRDLGLSAPTVLDEDRARGFLLLEDFGDETYARLLANGADEHALYALAVDTLVALQRAVAAGDLPDLPPYDEARLLAEAVLLVDWYLPAVLGAPFADGLREEYLELWRPVLAQALAPFAPTLVLRDFHIDNLVFVRRRAGVRRCGLLDFQDAVCGPPSYDLVSLTADARRDVSEELAAAMTARYLARFPQFDRPAFLGSAAVFAAQRNCKIIGIFTRLWRRDGKPGYLPHIPRLWRLVERDLRHPSLAPIRRWLDRHLPSAARRVPDTGFRG
jgi:aminoglycoside/choline kinase family phosphotransferase